MSSKLSGAMSLLSRIPSQRSGPRTPVQESAYISRSKSGLPISCPIGDISSHTRSSCAQHALRSSNAATMWTRRFRDEVIESTRYECGCSIGVRCATLGRHCIASLLALPEHTFKLRHELVALCATATGLHSVHQLLQHPHDTLVGRRASWRQGALIDGCKLLILCCISLLATPGRGTTAPR